MTINNDKCDGLQSTDVLITEAERGDNWSLAHEWVHRQLVYQGCSGTLKNTTK